jgi:hypothetical protein
VEVVVVVIVVVVVVVIVVVVVVVVLAVVVAVAVVVIVVVSVVVSVVVAVVVVSCSCSCSCMLLLVLILILVLIFDMPADTESSYHNMSFCIIFCCERRKHSLPTTLKGGPRKGDGRYLVKWQNCPRFLLALLTPQKNSHHPVNVV